MNLKFENDAFRGNPVTIPGPTKKQSRVELFVSFLELMGSCQTIGFIKGFGKTASHSTVFLNALNVIGFFGFFGSFIFSTISKKLNRFHSTEASRLGPDVSFEGRRGILRMGAGAIHVGGWPSGHKP